MTGPNAFLAEFDALAHGAFADAGMADLADYEPPAGGRSLAGTRRVFVDHSGQSLGEWDQVRAARTEVGVLLADGAVEAGGTLTLGSSTWTLQRIAERDGADGSLQWWVVA